MALVTNNISGSKENNSKIGITGSIIIADATDVLFPTLPSDVSFFVSSSINKNSLFSGGVVISGSLTIPADLLEVTGTISATEGFSGSLTQLTDGTSYLVAGANIVITSQSNGAVTVSSTAGGSPGGSDTHVQYNNAGFFGGDSNLKYDYTNQYFSISGSVAEGDGSSATGLRSHAEGSGSIASSDYSHAEGFSTTASGDYSHSEGEYTVANERGAHAEGRYTTASAWAAHSEGDATTASGSSSHAEGGSTIASGEYSHAEGISTTASGEASHAEGSNTQAINNFAHAEGYYTVATGSHSHAEGFYTVASGSYGSHAEGSYSQAIGTSSHAEGDNTFAIGDGSHAEGYNTYASGTYSHAGGYRTIASGSAQMVVGKYNLRGNDFSLFVVGNGVGFDDADRSDVFRVNSGSIGNGRVEVTGSLAVTGSLELTGSLFAQGDLLEMSGTIASTLGFSGSLTRLTDGTSYLIAGSNVTITSESNGAITISSAGGAGGGGGDPDASYLVLSATGSLTNERIFVVGTGLTSVDSGANGNYTLNINDSVVATVSGTTFTGATKHNSGLSGSLTQLVDGTSYLVAGTNVTITSQSNGQVTIAATAGSATPAGGDREIQFNNAGSFGASTYLKTLILGSRPLLAITGGIGVGRSVSPNSTYSFVHGYGTTDGTDYQSVFGQFNNTGNTDSLFVIGNGTSGGNRSDVVNVKAGTVGSGSLEVTGSVSSTQGFSGSLTTLVDGTSYLIAGNNVTITSQSNGSVEIASTGGGSGGITLQFLAGKLSSTSPSGSMESVGMDYLDTAALPPTPTYTFSAILAKTAGTTAYIDLYDYDGIIGGSPGPIAGSVLTGSSESYTYLTADVSTPLSLAGSSGIIEARIWCTPTGSNLNAICKSAKLMIS